MSCSFEEDNNAFFPVTNGKQYFRPRNIEHLQLRARGQWGTRVVMQGNNQFLRIEAKQSRVFRHVTFLELLCCWRSSQLNGKIVIYADGAKGIIVLRNI
ncbi:MAG: hypothetical protein SVY53_14115 [Chloroflexota bacterium]|nr:hypothetical protein [Chloroflexota bacterium]